MQGLTAGPRAGLDPEIVRALLTGDEVEIEAGLELVDSAGRVLEDLSEDLVGGEVVRDNRAVVHGSASLSLSRRLVWGRDRVRPFMRLSNDAVSARFNLGVYVMTTPETVHGEDPETYEVECFDLLHLLQDGPGDTYVLEPPSSGPPLTYIDAVNQVLTDSGVGAPVRLDGTLQSTPIVVPMVWALTEEPVSWLRIVNDLLAEINYRGLWASPEGVLRSAPYADPATRPEEWTFDTTDQEAVLLSEDRKITEDLFDAPNHWRFVRKGMTTEPVEGDGVYTVVNDATGSSSIMELGRTRRKVVFLEAADQASLEAQGDRIVSEDRALSRVFEVEVDPLPIAGHFDVVRLVDEGRFEKCQVTSWTLPLDGSRGRWEMEAV